MQGRKYNVGTAGFDHTWKNNYMMIITGTSRVKIMVERGMILSQSVHHPLERNSSKKVF